MSDIKSRVQRLDPNIEARDVKTIAATTGNIYEVLTIISKRATSLSQDIKKELYGKLEEFASTTDAIEEIHENKEQIEISKFYERLPNAVIIAYNEYMEDQLEYRHRDAE
ncbi:MAG: DNA-directed RNA polymerase subunit omega [Saprospiraceae bacterium]